jgi:hypothetical protein
MVDLDSLRPHTTLAVNTFHGIPCTRAEISGDRPWWDCIRPGPQSLPFQRLPEGGTPLLQGYLAVKKLPPPGTQQ